MPSIDPSLIRPGTGPGSRGDSCDICLDLIGDSDASITHVACQNTFHKICFDTWTDSNTSRNMSTTCPKCRATLYRPAQSMDIFGEGIDVLDAMTRQTIEQFARRRAAAPSREEDSEIYAWGPWSAFNSYIERSETVRATVESSVERVLQEARQQNVQHRPTEPQLTLEDYEMYDYAMTDFTTGDFDRVTPAWQHHFSARNDQAMAYLGDYFSRLRLAQGLSAEEVAGRIGRIYIMTAERPSHRDRDEVASEQGPGERATDLEIIDARGNRRPRKWLVDAFMRFPTRTRMCLRRRMARIQEQLDLDPDQTDQIYIALQSKVEHEARRRTLSHEPPPPRPQTMVAMEWP